MISNNGTTTPKADAAAVLDASTLVDREIAQDTLRQVAESVRSAFPRPSDVCELVLIDVDPHHVHAFWSVPAATAASVRSALGPADDSAPLVLRMTEILPSGESGDTFDIEVVGLQGQFYVDIWGDARRYQGEIGLRRRDGLIAPFTRSNIVVLPAAAPSADNTWREIALPAPPAPPSPPARPLPQPAVATSTEVPQPPDARPDSATLRPPPAERGVASEAAKGAQAPTADSEPTPPEPVLAGTDETATVSRALPPASPLSLGQVPAAQLQTQDASPKPLRHEITPSEAEPVEMAPSWAPQGQAALGESAPVEISSAWTGQGEKPPVLAPALEAIAASPSGVVAPSAEAEAAAIAGAIAAHEREAVTPLAPFPYYEPESEGGGSEPPPAESHAADVSAESPPPATGESPPSESPPPSEGPEPVPLPLENVLTLSSFAVAGGAVEFEINAELHIFGRAKPGMKLQLFGRPVTIRPDGTFSINRPLPNGALVLSVLLAKNGEREE